MRDEGRRMKKDESGTIREFTASFLDDVPI
jgi:hypothetical protein